MHLYFAPLACSMASRIALYEAGELARYTQVDTKRALTEGGRAFAEINPMRQVPVLEIADGVHLTENVAILQYIADRLPEARLAPANGSVERYRLAQWLNFISTELHKGTFIPQLDPHAPEGARAYAVSKTDQRLDVLNSHLQGRDYLLDELSVADFYLFTVLNWGQATRLDLAKWPHIKAYFDRLKVRPAVARALSEEFALYKEELARAKAA